MKQLLCATVLCLLIANAAYCEEAIPPSRSAITKDMVAKAVKYIQDNGIDKAKAAFAQKGDFFSGSYYIYVIQDDGLELVNPAFPELAGKNVLKLKDYEGKYITREILRLSKNKGKGWVNYRWKDPVSKRKIDKKAYIEREPGTGLTVCCGFERRNI